MYYSTFGQIRDCAIEEIKQFKTAIKFKVMEIINGSRMVGQIIVGTCETMCPLEEMIMREREGLLIYPFEVASDQQENTKRPKADPERVVKKYSRPAAGRSESDPENLRPAPVLKLTMKYLLQNIATMTKPAWQEIYAFVFDRIRAVRQDMVIQGISGQDAIHILEQAVRFHAYAAYRLRHARIDEYDPVINKHHLLECLKRLLYLYRVTKGAHCRRAQFEAVYLLDSLGDEIAMTHYLDLPLELRSHSLLRVAFEINKCFCQRNYLRVLRLIQGLTSIICLCVVSCHLYNLRVNFLQILSHAYSVKNCRFPLKDLVHLLHTTSEKDVVDICADCGLIDLFDQDALDFIQFNKCKFHRPSKEKPLSSLQVLDTHLKSSSISHILLGSEDQDSCLLIDSSCSNKTEGPNAIGPTKDKETDSFMFSLRDQFSQITLDNIDNKCSDEPVEEACHRENRLVDNQKFCANGTELNECCKMHLKEENMSWNVKNHSKGNKKMDGIVTDSPFARPGRGRGRGRGRDVNY